MDSTDKTLVSTLWCAVCKQYESRLESLKNFSRAWIDGSTNQKTSNIIDHALSDQHKTAMARLREERARSAKLPVAAYAPIAHNLQSTLDPAVKDKLKKTFDITYVLAKENLPFTKYPAIHELLEHYEVPLGLSYKTRESAQNFLHYIAESQQQEFQRVLSNSKFFSILMDGSVDKGKVENEVIVVQYCLVDNDSEEITSCSRFLKIVEPKKADANGLVECVAKGLQVMDVSDILDSEEVLKVEGKPVLVGVDTDGASVNISDQNGMKGILQCSLPWLFWSWCFAHCLELACKDSLCSHLFNDIDEMLLRLYYLYEKSPKKCRELADIVDDLKEVYEFPEGGNLPVRAQGSRWISHKRNALQRVLDRFGAYLNHLVSLSQDKTIKSVDRQKLKGYVFKWRNSRIIMGCAMYIDILQSPSLLSLSLQDNNLDIVKGIRGILKSHKSLKKFSSLDPFQWPTIIVTCSKIAEDPDEDGKYMYQGVCLKSYSESVKKAWKEQVVADLNRLDEKLRIRLEWSNLALLRAILILLDTKNWTSRHSSDSKEDDESLDEIKSSIGTIVEYFRAPLEAKNVELCCILDEIEDAVLYSRRYLNIEKDKYKNVWYRLHTAPDTAQWPNLLQICQLLFSLPFSTAKVERIFSVLKAIKTEKRTSQNTSTLEDLLELKVEGPPFSKFSADAAVELWWKDCSRRVQQKPRKHYKKRKPKQTSSAKALTDNGSESDEDSDNSELLTLWDDWFDFNSDDEIVSDTSTNSDSEESEDSS